MTDAEVEQLLAACGLVPPKKHAGGRPRLPIPHGTYRGYKAHQWRQEPPCLRCVEAHNAYQRGRYAELKQRAA